MTILERCDMQNNAAEELPPVLPLELRLTFDSLKTMLDRHGDALVHNFGDEILEKINNQLIFMKNSYQEELLFKAAVEYRELREFAGGNATVMPGTSSVEADFSLINWHKDPNSKSIRFLTSVPKFLTWNLPDRIFCGTYAEVSCLRLLTP